MYLINDYNIFMYVCPVTLYDVVMLAGPLSIPISWHRVQLTHLFKSGTPGQSVRR